MSPTAGFLVFLAVTLAFLGCVVVTGRKGRRKPHVILVACAIGSLATAIYFAEQLGELYDLESAGAITPIHLFLARLTVGAYLLPIVTGMLTWYRPRWKRRHGVVAFVVLGLTVVTAVTGAAMVLLSDPIDAG